MQSTILGLRLVSAVGRGFATVSSTAAPPPFITMVKKIKMDGSPCKKCEEVSVKMEKDGFSNRINKTIIADERDPNSEGMVLARKLDVKAAPFFLVREGDRPEEKVVTMYFQLKKDYLTKQTDDEEDIREIVKSGATDFI